MDDYKLEYMKESYLLLAGKFYNDLSHPLAVANNFEESSDEWIVGLFHDILEDTSIYKGLLFARLHEYSKAKLYFEIDKLTRRECEAYFDYIQRLDGIAKVVKIADLRHNLSRTETLKDSLKKRYEQALNILLKEEQ